MMREHEISQKLKVYVMARSEVDFILWVRQQWNQLCPQYQKRMSLITFKEALKKFQPER